jgi:hypothetical protein
MLRAVELEIQRVRHEDSAEKRGRAETGEDRAHGVAGLGRSERKIDQHEHRAAQGRHEQHFLVDEHLVRGEQAEDDPIAYGPPRVSQR